MNQTTEEMDFEKAFSELESTVRRLETGDLPLEDSLALFERGIALARVCEDHLDNADLRVRQLLPATDGGYQAEQLSTESTGTP